MQLEQSSVRFRIRSHYEALDLGCALVRRWPVALYLSWLVVALPAFLLANLLFSWQPFLVVLVFWWLKPLYERLPLWMISQAVFGEMPALRVGIRKLPSLLKPGLFGALTWRRLSPSRSFLAPVLLLEGLSGTERTQRSLVLSRSASSASFWLTIIGAHVEQFLTLGLLGMIALLVPQGIEFDLFTLYAGDERWVGVLVNSAYFLSVMIIGPVYVACGFALYINRRVTLEGWDIELGFRRLAARLAAASLLLVALVIVPPPAFAESPREESAQAIEQVLSDEVFGGVETFRCPAFLCEANEEEPEAAESSDFGWISDLFQVLAAVIEVLLWALLAALIAYLFWRFRVWTYLTGGERVAEERVTVLMGMSVAPESLPDDPAAQALSMWQDGQQRSASSLLYRATLIALLDRFRVPFADGDTESDCLRKARANAPDTADYLRRLTSLWQLVAYAHEQPADVEFAELCRLWSSQFGAAS